MRYKKRTDGFRSGYEAAVAKDLDARKIAYQYEVATFTLLLSAKSRHFCGECPKHEVFRYASYTPDFFLGNTLIVETKGKFSASDRKVALAFKEQHGNKWDYRILFQRDNTLTKASKTRYTTWCARNDIPCAVGKSIPEAWIK